MIKLTKEQKELAMNMYKSRQSVIKMKKCCPWDKENVNEQSFEEWLIEFAEMEKQAKEEIEKERKEFKKIHGVYPEEFRPDIHNKKTE